MEIKKAFLTRWMQHGLFWVFSFYVLFRIFNRDPDYFKTDLIYTALFHLSLVIAAYLNLELLIPYLLRPGRYLAYALALAGVLGGSAWLNMLTFNKLADWIFPGYYFIAYYEWADILQFVLVYLVFTTLLKLSKAWFDLRKKEQQISRLQREKLDAELQALKAQIDPHFLFNSLNNVFALSLDGDERVPDYLLRLSHNLRYMLYECGEPLVPLERELEYLENYIDLQRLRTGPEARIRWSVQGEAAGLRIAPLLLLPFVENAFKHGLKGRNRDAFVDIDLAIEAGSLVFSVDNNKGTPNEEIAGSGGIGLQNARKRLALLYPGKHQLTIHDHPQIFSIKLQIDLS